MGMILLGKLVLNWCPTCNVPVLEAPVCGQCGGATKKVQITPPGDVRPAFDYDAVLIRTTLDSQFGEGTGATLVPDDKVVILNKAPDIDRLDEIVVDGIVIGALRYDYIRKRFAVSLRPIGAQRLMDALAGKIPRRWVLVDEGAVEPLLDGASMLAPGVLDADDAIGEGDDVLLFDAAHSIIGFGTARLSGAAMKGAKRGVAVKMKYAVRRQPQRINDGGQTWDDAVAANKPVLDEKIAASTAFITKILDEKKLPYAVSFSGGKDSLATLLLVLDAGKKPPVFFVNTGLEFDATVRNAHEVAERYGLDLAVEAAPTSYFDNVRHFGPSARDFRWCCKTCKLGPTNGIIKRHTEAAGTVNFISFIGQRRYESEQRASYGKIWRNPWVPSQIGASPIQDWTALHVWLYIFSKKAPYNEFYEKGMNRIGCWLCPASDLADFHIMRSLPETREIAARWDAFLRQFARENGYTDTWADYGLWRFLKPPKELMATLERAGIDTTLRTGAATREILRFERDAGDETHLKGHFSAPPVMDRVANLLAVFGDDREGAVYAVCDTVRCTVVEHDVTLSIEKNGAVTVTGGDAQARNALLSQVRGIVLRAAYCVGCELCVNLCVQDALRIENGCAVVDSARCIHCRDCLGRCPIADFTPRT